MSEFERATLTLEAEFDGAQREGVFEMVGGLTIQEGIQQDFIFGQRGSAVNSVISSLSGDKESKNKAFYLDLSTGQHTVDVAFRGWEGAYVGDEDYQWGDVDGGTYDATGEDPLSQVQVFIRWLLLGEYDSRDNSESGTATLEYGQYSSESDTRFDPLEVVIVGPQTRLDAEEPNGWTGDVTFIERASFEDALDAVEMPEWG